VERKERSEGREDEKWTEAVDKEFGPGAMDNRPSSFRTMATHLTAFLSKYSDVVGSVKWLLGGKPMLLCLSRRTAKLPWVLQRRGLFGRALSIASKLNIFGAETAGANVDVLLSGFFASRMLQLLPLRKRLHCA
jgi:hypothetical protein